MIILDRSLWNEVVYNRLHSSVFHHDEDTINELKSHIVEAQKLNKNEDKKEHKKDENFFTVYLTDATKNLTKFALSANAISHLQHSFDDVLKIDDKTFLLTEESAAYVNGWYKEVSFARNYKGADENNDFYIDENEALNVKGFFYWQKACVSILSPYKTTYLEGVRKYRSLSNRDDEFVAQVKNLFVEESLNVALDKSLLLDKDLDGKILYKEAMNLSDLRNVQALLVEKGLEEGLAKFNNMNEYFEYMRKIKEQMAQEVANKAQEELEIVRDNDEEEKNEIRLKLLANGVSGLSMEELELARKYFPNLIKDTQDSKGIDSLIKDLQTNFLKIRDNALNLNV